MKIDSAPLSVADFKPNSAALTSSPTKVFNSTATLEKSPTVDAQTTPVPKRSPFRAVFSSTFVTIFLAEVGDKTQLSTLLMSAESQAPGVVFLGAATALIATSLIGVILGQWIASKFSPKTVEIAAGVSLLFISGMLLLDIIAA